MSEIETPTTVAQIAPEDLLMDEENVMADAQGLANNVVGNMPTNLSPAQERALVTNSINVYAMVSRILSVMLESKRGSLH